MIALQDREATRTGNATSGAPDRVTSPSTPKAAGGGDAEMENERLKSFFASLAKKSGGSAANSPRRGGD